MTEAGKCLFCDFTDFEESFMVPTLFNSRRFTYQRCRRCGLISLNPSLSLEDYDKLYPPDYHHEFYSENSKEFNSQWRLVKKFTFEKRILDYGCGSGEFISFLSSKGYKATGVEFSHRYVAQLTTKYPNIDFVTLDEFKGSDSRFDIIHLGDVLEHLNDPMAVMSGLITEHLVPNGIIFIEGPLENNFNLAQQVRVLNYKISRWRSPEKIAEHRPFHTFFSNQKNQLSFFMSLKLVNLSYRISEDGWPFALKRGDVKGVKTFVQFIVAWLSIGISKIVPFWGSRFTFIGKLKTTL